MSTRTQKACPPAVAFIIGGGPRIGWSVASRLQSEGYKIAVGSRNPDTARAEESGFLPVSVDVSDSQSVRSGFETVRQKLGVPGVVVYNGNLSYIYLISPS